MKDQSYDKNEDTQDNELLSQYLDGELASQQSLQLKQRLLAEPALRANLERMKQVNSRLHQAFNQPGVEHVSHDTRALLEQTSVAANASKVAWLHRPLWSYAVAATIAVAAGVMMVPQWGTDSSPTPQTAHSVDRQLSQALESTPSLSEGWTQLDDGRSVRPVLSFQTHAGTWCREFLVQHESNAERGIACRDEQNWEVKVLAATDLPGSASEYRPAGSNTGGTAAAYIAEQAAGIALGKEEEADIIATGWQ